MCTTTTPWPSWGPWSHEEGALPWPGPELLKSDTCEGHCLPIEGDAGPASISCSASVADSKVTWATIHGLEVIALCQWCPGLDSGQWLGSRALGSIRKVSGVPAPGAVTETGACFLFFSCFYRLDYDLGWVKSAGVNSVFT